MASSPLIAAAAVTLYINGRPYAQVSSFRWDSDTPMREIYGIDSGEPYELAPTQSRISGNIGLYRLIGDGGIEGAGATVHYGELPRQKYFTLSLVLHKYDLQLFYAGRCSVVRQNWDVPAKGLITGAMSFKAIDWNNEVRAI